MIKHCDIVERAVLDLPYCSVLNKNYRYMVQLRYEFHCRLRKVKNPQDQINTDYCLFVRARDSLDRRLAHYAKNGIDTTEVERERNAVIELLARLSGGFSSY